MGVDAAYFSPREAANRSRQNELDEHAGRYEQIGHTTMQVRPGTIQSGYIFTRVDEGTKTFVEIPGHLHGPIRQDGILLAHGAGNAAALAFLEFLQSDAVQAKIAAYGY